jgi:hypothetical protein
MVYGAIVLADIQVKAMGNDVEWGTESVVDTKDSVGSGDSRLKIAFYHLVIGVV